MTITLIVAASLNNAIGKDNQLLWHLPNDLKFFKDNTWAMPVAMGRKTFESLGNKPLNGRFNIIISRNAILPSDNVMLATSIEDAVSIAEKAHYKELMILGGGEIYRQAIAIADKILLTRVDALIDGDTFFPAIETTQWKMVLEEKHEADEKHAYNYSFQTWIRL